MDSIRTRISASIKNIVSSYRTGTLSRNICIISLILFICYSYAYFLDSENLPPNTDFDITSYAALPLRVILHEEMKDLQKLYYRNVKSNRNSSYPLISGDTFRAIADHVFDELRQDKFESMHYGDVVFVKGDMFFRFFHGPFKNIDTPFVLVSHNTDSPAPGEHRLRLNDKRILAWYATNPSITFPKLYPVPIGFPNAHWPRGNISMLLHAAEKYRKPWHNRSTLLYVNFSPFTNRYDRPNALGRAKIFKNVQIINERISFETFLEHLGNAKFVLSPPGNGYDCHRTWEALLMGAAPVVVRSGVDSLFKQLPAVVLDRWENLTERYLSSLNFRSYDNLTPTILFARYWRQKFRKHRFH
ncbi:unnamed protein product [Adineta ricciae]|uniref:Exostosin GT47 domain-containing protein n=1 Tax=Adineta ricciae TaxID=249248 RepID=A0A814ZYT1_ADIRI|nr:unnamed protein product [Adineta ricciae]CAF1250257.1 unnamed protein product [Adineta ricciae]